VSANRSSVVAAAIVQLVYFQLETHKHDATLDPWRSAIANQVVQCLSIITTCLPYAKTLMESLESGMMRVDDLRRRGENFNSSNNSRGYELMGSSHSIHAEHLQKQAKSENQSLRSNTIKQTKTWTVEVDSKALSSKDDRSLRVYTPS
jgi:hypothetical protein